MNRRLPIAQALATDGVPPARAEQLVRRLEGIAKRRRRRRRLEPIDRDRRIIRVARAELATVVGDCLATQPAALAAQIVQARARLTKIDGDDVDAILAALDLSAWGTLQGDVAPILMRIALDGIAVAYRQLGFPASHEITDQVNAKALAWAKERAAELVGKRVMVDGSLIDNPDARWAITESTRERLRSTVATAIEEGSSAADLEAVLEASYAFSDARAETVARTELARADVEGNLVAYRDSGVVGGKEWVLGSEHEDIDCECETAAAMGVVPLDSDFGGIGDPPAHPNCVCDVLPVVGDEGG